VEPIHESAIQTLESLRLTQRKFSLQTALLRAGSLTVILTLSLLFLEAIGRMPAEGRIAALLTAFALLLSAIAFLYIRHRNDYRLAPGFPAESYWALRLGELASPERADRLLNAIQIQTPSRLGKESPSIELARDALLRAVSGLGNVDKTATLDRSERKQAFKISLWAVAALIGGFLINPASLTGASVRLLHPNTDFQPPPPFSLAVDPAGGWCYRGEPVTFNISVIGQAPRKGEFSYRQDGGEEVTLELDLARGTTQIGFEGFASEVTYHVSSGPVSTREYRLDVVARPQIVQLNVKVAPPPYTGLPVQIGRENSGDIEALPGSRAEIEIETSKELERAVLVGKFPNRDSSAVDSIAMTVTGRQASLGMTVRREGTYTLRLWDRQEHPDRDPVIYRIHLLPDESPAVVIAYPDEDVVLGDEMAVPMRIEADDDYGVGRLELRYHRLDGDSSLSAMPLGSGGNKRTFGLDTLWNIGRLALMPGDVLEYWAAAWDNDVVNGPKMVESARRTIRLPTFEEIASGIEQTESEAEIDAHKALESAKDLKEEVSKLVEEMRRDPNANWERQQQIEEAVKGQEKLAQKTDQVSKTLDDLVKRLEKFDMLSPETLQKYQELQKLMSEVASPELQEAMKKLQEAMASQDPEKMRQALEDFDQNREEFLKNIERSLAILQQLKLERKLDELAKRAEEMLHAQEEALRDLESGANDDAAREFDLQQKRLDALKREIEDADSLARELGAEQLSQNLDSLSAALEKGELKSTMSQAAQASRSGQNQQAKSSGEEGARKLAELSSSLQRMSQEYKDQKKSDLARRIQRLVEELLYVSQDQEDLITQSREMGTQSPRYRDLAGSQQSIKQGLEGITERMMVLSQQTFFITPDLGATIGRGLNQIDIALESYSDRTPRSAATSQRNALGEINRSAAQLLSILSQLSGSNSSSGFEEMMQKLSEMASAQQGLNQQSMPMPGGTQGEMPMDGQSLTRMAAQQRALQQQMEQAAKEAQGIQDVLGDLQGIAEAMGEVAKDMENQQMTDRTRRLQQQIVSRLLDATRSAKEEEYSKKRESKTGGEFVRRSPGSLKPEDRQNQLRQDMLKALQQGYSPDYRRLIQAYFQALEEMEGKKK
jgi:hypothetical protein